MLRLFVAVLAAVGLAGCGGGGGQETDGTGSMGATDEGETDAPTGEPVTEVAFERFHEAAEEAFCAWQTACRQYGVEARCRAVNHLEARLSMQRLAGVGPAEAVPIDYLKEAVEVGRIEYDEKKAATCLDYVRGRTCERVHVPTEAELAGQAACAGVFRGRMGRNGPCVSATECAEASVCGFDPNCTAMGMCCVGACRVLAKPAAIGEPCPGTIQCEADAFCDVDPVTFLPTVCKPAPTLGQACPAGVCASGSLCEFDGNTQTCVAPKQEGAPCYVDQECAGLAVCRYNENNFESRCFRLRAEGETCDPNVDGPQCLRQDNGCRPDGVCGPLPGNGEPCPHYECQGDLFCATQAGLRCVPVADAGERCGYVPDVGDYIPCSGDHSCDGEFDAGSCGVPSGSASCPVPDDPGA